MRAVMNRQVRNAVDAGDGDYMIRSLRRQVAAEPANLAARLALAAHYEKAGFPEIAVEHCRLAVAAFPDSAEAHVRLARGLRRMDLRTQGVQILEEFAQRSQPAAFEVHSWLGILQDELGEPRTAEQHHRQALQLASGRDELHNNLGYNLLMQGRSKEAADEFRRALALAPDSRIARNNLGLALAATPQQAVGEWKSASDTATAHNNLAAVLIEKGEYVEARKELETALQHQPNHAAALSNLQLISEIDGSPIELRAQDQPSVKGRVVGFLHKVFGGPEPHANEKGANGAAK